MNTMSVTPIASNQEAFDMAYNWAKDHDYCVSQNGVCCYTNQAGNHCLVGAMMPEEIASTVNDGDVDDLLFSDNSVRELFFNVNKDLLKDIQLVHDQSYRDGRNKEAYLEKLREVAARFNLTVPEVK